MPTLAEVAKHNKPNDCWVVINGNVYDVTKFAPQHPGGKKILLREGGKDASAKFKTFHSPSVLVEHKHLLVGPVGEDAPAKAAAPTTTTSSTSKVKGGYGDMVPYGDPLWYQGFASPYYSDTHREFRDKVRRFVDAELRPNIAKWDEEGTYPPDMHRKAYEAGIYGTIYPEEYGGTPPPQFDAFHQLILVDELARCGGGGVLWAVFFSFGISLPPVLAVGSKYLRDLVARDVITGKKIMSLAVSEPWAGSDVANLQTTARRDGDFYVINGAKKWITSGTKAHYYTVAVRTGGRGMGGVSLLLVERETPGVKVRRMKTQGWWTSNTAYITFEDVRVPVRNLIGRENDGFRPIMRNFNSERFVFAAMSNRYARVCVEDAIAYGRERKTFGKRLMDHQVLRHKVAEMARRVASTHALLETVAYQLRSGEGAANSKRLGGLIALTKVQATKTFEFCAREASQIFGGNACIREGPGARVERLYREVRTNAVGGGSEEVLMNLAMSQARL